MKAGFVAVTLGYVLSQFYRAFLAVLSPALSADLGAAPETLAAASGWWFLSFALMQLPVGEALDRIGPRRTAAGLMAVAALGAAVFATARGALQVNLAMALIGAGCGAALMAPYYIFARTLPPARFASLAAAMVGVGSLGNIGASLPLSAAVEAFGWRATVWGLAGVTGVVALAVAAFLRDPPRLQAASDGSVLDVLRLRPLWPVLALMAACYAPSAGLRGLWAGPWQHEVFGADAARIGQVTLVMGLAMVAGSFAYGPVDRLFGTRKWVLVAGNLMALAALLALAARAGHDGWTGVALLAAVGAFGAAYPLVMAHGRAFLPAHLTGRGVSLINLAGIGGAGLMQLATGRLYAALPHDPPAPAFAALFLAYAALLAAGLLVYLTARDRTD